MKLPLFKKRNTNKNISRILIEHESLLSTIYNNITIGFSIYDSNGILIDVNNALLKMLGIPNKEAVKGICLFDDPQSPPDQIEKFKRGENTNYVVEYNLEKSKDYLKSNLVTTKTFSVHLSVVKDDNKDISLYIFSIEDITEIQKRQEEFDKLSNSNQRLLSSLPIGVGIYDTKGNRIFINEAWAK